MAQGDQRPRQQRQQSRISKPVKVQLNGENTTTLGADSDTVRLIKKTLCAQQSQPATTKETPPNDIESKPLQELLPPLTSSNEVDFQLYAIIAVILKQFVQVWYNRLTPDQDFVAEIVQIIAHCTRGIEQRLRQVDLGLLLLDELPALLVEHVDGMRLGSFQTRIDVQLTSSSHQDRTRRLLQA